MGRKHHKPEEIVTKLRQVRLCCMDRPAGACASSTSPLAFYYARRTYSGRPSSSIRFSACTAMATSVARRRSVRKRSPAPMTRLRRLMSAATRAREL
jgi:hypothetical protein